ncbi:MAG: hypothetical protein HRT45_12880 [Bdellovibrionales bacterium]|nr:hypothetical protein [Bdellovibrionales bacterium]
MEFNGRVLARLGVLIVSFFSVAAIASPSFEGNTDFVSVQLDGQLFVRCSDRGQVDSRWQRCRGNLLNPTGAFARFQVDSDIRTNRVELKSTWENGKQVSRRPRWDSENSQTKRTVNLWVETVFQTPLLDYGKNWVEYRLVEDRTGRTHVGAFAVNVDVGEPRTCPDDSVFSSNMDDCRFGSTSLCSRYFQQNNYCR